MDILPALALLGLLLLAALPFLFAGDKLFWLPAIVIVLFGGPLLVLFYIANQNGNPMPYPIANQNANVVVRSVVAVIAGVAVVVLVTLLAKRRLRAATLLMGPLSAGVIMIVLGVMLVTGGAPILLLIGFMGGGLEFWLYSALVLFLLGALPVLAIAWKSAPWARIAVSSLFGVLILATLLSPLLSFVDRSGPGRPPVYLAALAVAGVVAALGLLFQYRQRRGRLNGGQGERMPA